MIVHCPKCGVVLKPEDKKRFDEPLKGFAEYVQLWYYDCTCAKDSHFTITFFEDVAWETNGGSPPIKGTFGEDWGEQYMVDEVDWITLEEKDIKI